MKNKTCPNPIAYCNDVDPLCATLNYCNLKGVC